MRDVGRRVGGCLAALGLALALASPAAHAQKVSFKDAKDDDNGPGKYTYPTDPVYKPGSFDLTGFTLKAHGDKVDLDVELAAKLEDPWKTGSGFSLQMVFVFIQTHPQKKAGGAKPGAGRPGRKPPGADKSGAGKAATATGKDAAGKPAEETAAAPAPADNAAPAETSADQAAGKPPAGSPETPTATGDKTATEKPAAKKTTGGKAGKTGAGTSGAGEKTAGWKPGITAGLPGLGIQFAPEDGWDRCIILSPLPASRVRSEVAAKAAALKDAIVIPARVRGSGRSISATVDRKALGPGDPTDWGYQVVIAGSDSYPAADSLLVRKVIETETQHRFGGADGACNPNVLDLLADDGEGEPEEVAEQHEMLQYECNPDGTPKHPATLKLVHLDKSED
ncbi:MAG TPA: glucodextranase DOMON-like domain-containing protein [Thermoanaerobaculia bacterium]|nr:glucodextranase DOMON-like domain-containing protein [Thermoanaerobaculia bacterium]